MVTVDSSRSRRAILAGALGGIGAWVATAVSRTSPVRAGVDGDVVLGTSNVATNPTTIQNSANNSTVFQALSLSNGRGIEGTSHGGQAVAGLNESSSTGVGVYGYSAAASGPAVVGESAAAGTGVLGYSGSGLPAAVAKTGVFGQATQDANSRGVWGKSTSGRGIFGEATNGWGVRGWATSGAALYGAAATGYALRTSGRVRLDKSAGKATITAGSNSVVVTPGVDLTSASAVVATLQGTAGGTTTVHRVVVNAAANTFTIYLTGNAASNVKVAWILLG